MSCNYRIIETVDAGNAVCLDIHEVFYDVYECPYAYAINSVRPHAETLEELRCVLENMLVALNQPVLVIEPAKSSGEPSKLVEKFVYTPELSENID